MNLYTLVDRMSLIEDKSIKGKDSFKLFKSLKSSSSLKFDIFWHFKKWTKFNFISPKKGNENAFRERAWNTVHKFIHTD